MAGIGIALRQSIPYSLLAMGNHTQVIGHEPVTYFDAFTRIGPYKYEHPESKWRLNDLITELAHCSISGALVSSTLSVTYDAMHSNLELSNWLKPYQSLFAIWNVMPGNTDEFPSPDDLGKLMREYNVRAVTIHPSTNAWDWKAVYNQDILKWLSENHILTIIEPSELGEWDNLEQFLGLFPELPILVTNVSWDQQRYLIPSMLNHRNLHCSFDHLQNMYGIEYMRKKGLINQMLFASCAPGMSAGAHRTFIDYADIEEEDRVKIAGGNLTRLLHGQKPSVVASNNNEDQLMSAVRHGIPLAVPVMDMHMHILEEGMNGAGGGYTMENGGPAGVFPLIKKLGYTGGGFMSWNGVVSSDATAGNIVTGKCLDVAPAGYWGLASFDPVHYSQAELAKMIPALYTNDKRFIGMKPYHLLGIEYHEPVWNIWWKYGNDHALYALLHSERGDMQEFEILAVKFPRVRWIIAHAGQSFLYADKVIEVMKKHSNIYAEITLTPVCLGVIDYLVAGVGERRVLYGSDLPMRDPRPQLGWVVFSHLSPEAKSKVLGKNAADVIKPCWDRLPAYNRPPSYRN